jgi:hypothetical protein
MDAAKKEKGVSKKSKKSRRLRVQQLPPPPSISDDIVTELQGATLEQIVQLAKGPSRVKSGALPQPQMQKQAAQPRNCHDRNAKPGSACRIGKDGCKLRTLASEPLYKSSTISTSAREFMQTVESKRTRRRSQC